MDGATLETGVSLLQDLTSGLETCTDLSEAQEFISQVEPELTGRKRCVNCGKTRELAYFALDASKPLGHSEVCVACDSPEAWESVQSLKAELKSLPPGKRQERFIQRGKELGLVKELPPEQNPPKGKFPKEYRGVKLDKDEREVIADYLGSLQGKPAAATSIEYLYVADALCIYGRSLIKQAQENRSTKLARAGCESASKGMMIAQGECWFIYSYARCLDAAGFDATNYFRLFLEKSAKDPGVRGRSDSYLEEFRWRVEDAKKRLAGSPR